MAKGRKIIVRKLGPNGHSTSLLSIPQACQELSNALEEGYIIYVDEPWKYVIQDKNKLISEISKIKNVVVILPVSGG
ncbi:MAG: hypothetical protein B6U95_07080 [Thermofilum sp. ex4484_82]|nr:MAG: hypothetical protein B6U95_07080 [Thermofilum sp. ex4484_82]OYT37282.1 MAG: hypothetical protein B6U96_07075 [Archaeoglobales archaeon ex4484_92]